jgi:hypothetical protein
MRPMRRFKQGTSASTFGWGHTLIRNLAHDHAARTAQVPPRLRLASAWAALIATL